MLRNPGLRKSVEQPVLDLNFAASQIGSNAAPDSRIDFSRGSNAYFVDSDGLLKKSPHNLLTKSEDITAWTSFNTTVSANAAESPTGELTADKSIADSGQATHVVRRDIPGLDDSVDVAVSVYLKQAGFTSVAIQFYDKNVTFHSSGNFDLTDGSRISNATSGTQSSIEHVGNDWYRITFTGIDAGSGSQNPSVRIGASGTGDGSKGFLVWGAQLSQHSTLPVDNPYIKTEGSAVYAARLDHDPATNTPRGLLIEEARTNLVTDSESHTYLDGDINVTQSGSAGLAPDGTNTAIAFMETAATGDHVSRKAVTIADNQNIIFSFFAKANGRTSGQIEFFDAGGAFAFFDLASGTINSATVYSSATNGSSSIEDYGNGWFRVSLGLTTVSGDTSGTVQVRVTNAAGQNSYAGDATKGLFIWGLQLEQGSFPTSYIKTTGSTVTRNADVATMGPTTGGTELVTNGTFDTDSDWTDNGSGTIAISSGKLTFASTAQFKNANQSLVPKLVAGRRYRASFDVTSYTSGTLKLQYREGSGNTLIAETPGLTSTGTYTFDFTCSDAAVNKVQILTTGSGTTNTYEVDNISVRELYPFEQYNPAEGTVVCDFERHDNTAFDFIWDFGFGTNTENTFALLHLDATRVYHSVKTANAQQITYSPTTVEPGDKGINAFAYQTNNVNASFSRNGSFTHSFNDTSYSIPPADKMAIGSRHTETAQHNGYIKRLTYYPYRLNDAVCDSKVTS